MQQRTRFNHQINAPEVRVINEDGEQIGVMRTSEALKMAGDNGLDLVEISPNARPPVAKIIDFAKFKYQQQKAEAAAKKNAKKTEVKTIWVSARIGEHDMKIKADKVSEFLKDGDLVKIELRMKGREQAYPEQAKQQLEKFLAAISQPFRRETPIARLGRTFAITVAPGK